MAQSNVELRINSSQAVRALKVVDGQAKKFNTTIQKSGGTLKNTSKGLFGFGTGARAAGAGAAVATPAVAGLGLALNSALAPLALVTAGIGLFTKAATAMAEQDKANASLRTLGVDSVALEGKLKGLSDELKNQFSVTELTVAAYDVASAGFTDAADAAMVLKASAQAASAGMADIATTGDAVTTVLNAWKLSGEDATMVADKMQQTVADGKIKISEYASNIGKVATTAAQLKIPLSEVNASISLATKSGVNAERAFTGINAALAQIAGGQAGKKLGMEIDAATLESDGLLETLRKISKVPVGDQIKALGREGHAAMGPVLADLEQYEQMLKNQENSTGKAAEAAGEMAQTIGGAWAELTKGIGNAFTLGDETRELLTTTIQFATWGLKTIGRLLKPVFDTLKDIVWVINQIHKAIKAVVDATPEWMKRFLGVSDAKAEEETPASKAAKDMKDIADNAEGAANNIKKTNNELNKTPEVTDKIKTDAEHIKEKWKEIGDTIKSDVTNSIKEAIKGGQSLGQSMTNILGSIADKAMDVALNMALWGSSGTGGMLGGLFTGIFGSAQGGTIGRGNPRIVGERGPEIFIPHSSGEVVPNHRLGGGSNVTVNVDAKGNSQVEGDEEKAKQLGSAISAAVQAELVKQKMPGGLLFG